MLAVRTRGRIFGDVNSMQSQIQGFDIRLDPTLGQTCLAITNRLDLGSPELHPAFKRVADSKIMPGAAIFDHRLFILGTFFLPFGGPELAR